MVSDWMRNWPLTPALAVLTLAATAWLGSGSATEEVAPFIEIADGAWMLAEPDQVARFRLQSDDGKPFDNAALMDRWSFVFFGYTYCPDICPATLFVFKTLHQELAGRQTDGSDVQYVFVSIDPDRDTAERLQEYVSHFDPTFIGVTGDDAELSRLSESVGVVYAKVPLESGDDYLMDHSSAVLLINPEGRLHAVFAAPHVPETLLQAFDEVRGEARDWTR